MLFKSLCLLSPYMHHFISSIIITVLCVSKITCPCFPISGFIKTKFTSSNNNLLSVNRIKTIQIYIEVLRKLLRTFRMAAIYLELLKNQHCYTRFYSFFLKYIFCVPLLSISIFLKFVRTKLLFCIYIQIGDEEGRKLSINSLLYFNTN